MTVGPAELASIAVTPADPTIALGTDQQFTVTGTYSDGSTTLTVEEGGVELGSIRIRLDSLPNAGQDFVFTGDLGSFTLDDDADATRPRQRTFADLPAGSYDVTQATDPAAWSLLSITCTTGVAGVDRTAAIAAGTFVTGNRPGGTYTTIEVRVTVGAAAGPNASKTVLVEIRSDSKPNRVDVVRAITSR